MHWYNYNRHVFFSFFPTYLCDHTCDPTPYNNIVMVHYNTQITVKNEHEKKKSTGRLRPQRDVL